MNYFWATFIGALIVILFWTISSAILIGVVLAAILFVFQQNYLLMSVCIIVAIVFSAIVATIWTTILS
jgi:hypothetical protein